MASGQDFYDQRSAASFILYPQPLGFQMDYNIGTGPEYDPDSNTVEHKNLEGGYAMVNYQYYHQNHRFFPYLRYQVYNGGKKMESASLMEVEEVELGTEWQPNSGVELTIAYANSDRLTQSSSSNRQHEIGHLLRLQAQFN